MDFTLILLLIGLNAIFALSEMAVVASRSARLQQLVARHAGGAQVLQLPCPGLADAIEAAGADCDLTSAEGRVVEGEFKDGKIFNGHGSLLLPTGTVFEGGWVEGKKHGSGTLTSADGKVMTGEFRENKILLQKLKQF